MPKPKKKISLIASEIIFNYFCIIYKVTYADGYKNLKHTHQGIISCADDISIKDLNLKPTIISKSMEVVFSTVYATPHFYQSLVEKTRKDFEEYRTELNNIYQVGDVVGYLFI